MQVFTPEDLVQYLYSETSPEKSAAIKAALESDWSLRESFEALVSAHHQLEKVNLSPRSEVIEKLLKHAERPIAEIHED